ncbi:MAG: GtrA family protein [Pseudomonadota bacterium]
MVGVLATASHYAVMFAGISLFSAPVLWSFIGAVVGAVVGYLLNYLYTFQSSRPHKQTTWRYGVITVLSILLNTAIFYILHRVAGLPVILAQLFSTALVFVCNYLAHKSITFDEKAAGPS